MTPEELASGSGWTVDTLMQSIQQMMKLQNSGIDRRISDLISMLNERALSQQRAIDALAIANEKALIKVDEKNEKALDEIRKAIVLLSEDRSQQTGRRLGNDWLITTLFALASLGVGGVMLVIAIIK